MQMSGNTILITGGGSGIGRAPAEAYHADRNHVVIAGHRKEVIDAVTAANPGMKGAIQSFGEQLVADNPTLKVVIHDAGIMKRESVEDGKVADVEAMITTNLLPTLLSQPHAAITTR